MKMIFGRFWLPMALLVLLAGLVGAAVALRAEPALSPPSPPATSSLADIWNPAVDKTWEETVTRDSVFVNKVRVSRTGVWSGGVLTGCSLSVTYTASSAAKLNRVRLTYTPGAGGADVVLDDASEANGRIDSTDDNVTVSGTAPATARKVSLLWTPDDGSESVVYDYSVN